MAQTLEQMESDTKASTVKMIRDYPSSSPTEIAWLVMDVRMECPVPYTLPQLRAIHRGINAALQETTHA